jgi:hypothetical protein
MSYASIQESSTQQTALEGFMERIDLMSKTLSMIEQTADRACGDRPPSVQSAKPAAVPNGLLDHIEARLEDLHSRLSESAQRLGRIA